MQVCVDLTDDAAPRYTTVCGGAQDLSPLQIAVESSHLDIARLLLDRGADKDAKRNVRALQARDTLCLAAPCSAVDLRRLTWLLRCAYSVYD